MILLTNVYSPVAKTGPDQSSSAFNHFERSTTPVPKGAGIYTKNNYTYEEIITPSPVILPPTQRKKRKREADVLKDELIQMESLEKQKKKQAKRAIQ